jgi:hypothetical protein
MSIQSWHKLCTLREDVRTGSLTLAEFAADSNGVCRWQGTWVR